MYRRSQRWMLIINNKFLSLYDYNFLLVIENKIHIFYAWKWAVTLSRNPVKGEPYDEDLKKMNVPKNQSSINNEVNRWQDE